jgi:acyl-CoA thioesterase-1
LAAFLHYQGRAVKNVAFIARLSVALALLPLGCATGKGPTASSEVSVARHVVVLGDSLAVSPSRQEGFPVFVQQRISEQRLEWTVINAGVRGDTTSGGLRRLEDVLDQRPDVLIVALGSNDGLRGVATTTIARNLSEIISRAKARGARVLLAGMETPPLHGWNYTLAFHNVFPGLAREHDVPLVPFLLAGVALDPELNGEDMIHPNAAGARRIAATIWPYLAPLLTSPTITATRVE